MNGLEFLAEKIGRKQLIAIVGMLLLSQMEGTSWMVTAVAFAGIGSQLVIDWYHPTNKKETEKPI